MKKKTLDFETKDSFEIFLTNKIDLTRYNFLTSIFTNIVKD